MKIIKGNFGNEYVIVEIDGVFYRRKVWYAPDGAYIINQKQKLYEKEFECAEEEKDYLDLKGETMENQKTLSELRQKLGMTQEEFAKYYKIPLATIRNWEQGRTKCPDYLLDLMQYKADIEFF